MAKFFDRGCLLYEQKRYQQALDEFQQALADEPNDAQSHVFAALCLMHLEKLQAATDAVQEGIKLEPASSMAYHAAALIYQRRHRLDEAQVSISKALELEPSNQHYLGTAAMLCCSAKDWRQALHLAERGLEQKADHDVCANARALALVKLGRVAEAREYLQQHLGQNPEHALTQANLGWNALERGDREQALQAFREALRIDAEMEWARAGMLEALKLGYPWYGFLLRYFLFMSRLQPKNQFGFITLLFAGNRYLSDLVRRYPVLRPLLIPLLWCYRFFAYSTWTASPLTNLLLRFNEYGRATLTEDQIRETNLVGSLLLGGVLTFFLYGHSGAAGYAVACCVCLTLVIPVAATFSCRGGWPRLAMGAYTAALAIIGAYAAVKLLMWNRDMNGWTAFNIYVMGMFWSGWVANALVMVKPKK